MSIPLKKTKLDKGDDTGVLLEGDLSKIVYLGATILLYVGLREKLESLRKKNIFFGLFMWSACLRQASSITSYFSFDSNLILCILAFFL